MNILRELYTKLEKRVYGAPRRIMSFYNNMIAGIAAAISIAWATIFLPYWILSIIFVIILPFPLYFLGKWIISKFLKDNKELQNYTQNFTAALISSVYVSLVILFKSSSLIKSFFVNLILTVLLVVSFFISAYFIAKQRKKKYKS